MQTDKTTLNTVEEEQRLAVKVALGDDKRVLLLSGPSYALLATKVAAAFNLPAGSFAVRYLDDEKDHITASSDEELQVALQFASGSGLLRLDVVPLQHSPVAGEKRPRRRSVDESDDEAFVDPQAVAYLAQQMHGLHAIEVKPKKCAKFLRRSDGDVAQAQILLDAWCHKRAAKALKKQEKEQKKDRHHKVAVDRCGEEESPEIKEKLDQLEARGYPKRKKNAKVLAKCEHDFEKALEVLECKAAKKEAKREWKCAKKEKKLGKKALKREYKLERKGSKAAFKKHKKNCKREAKLLKQQYRGLSYQELSSATTSPMLATAGGP